MSDTVSGQGTRNHFSTGSGSSRMECPRCGGPLSRYQLGEKVSYACDECVYVGIEVSHRTDPRQLESWDEALSRFYHRRTTGDAPSDVPDDDTTAEQAEPTDHKKPAEGTRDADDEENAPDVDDGDSETVARRPPDGER